MRRTLTLVGFLTTLSVAGCGFGGPAPTLYVLGAPSPALTVTRPQAGLPVVEVASVRVPDYLDSTDLSVRNREQIVPSQTGRWGERLSVGVTRALTADLASLLPQAIVTATTPIEQPARRVLVDISDFAARADGPVFLAARWTVTDATERTTFASKQLSLVEPVPGRGDAAVVAAMSNAIARLANEIAPALRYPTAGSRTRRP